MLFKGLKTLAATILFAATSQAALANSNFSGVSLKEIWADDQGQVRIEVDTSYATSGNINIPSCARITQETYFIFDATTTQGKVWYDLVLNAKNNNKLITVNGFHTCLTLGSHRYTPHEQLLSIGIL